MRPTLAFILAPLLAACTQAVPPEPEPDASPAPSAQALTRSPESPGSAPRVPAELVPAAELVGEWRVAGVDGMDIDLPYGITASITTNRIHVVADCVNVAWSYAAESGAISTKRVPVEGCARGFTPEEEAIVKAIDTATGFGRVPSNAIEIFSRQHRVTLFSQ